MQTGPWIPWSMQEQAESFLLVCCAAKGTRKVKLHIDDVFANANTPLSITMHVLALFDFKNSIPTIFKFEKESAINRTVGDLLV